MSCRKNQEELGVGCATGLNPSEPRLTLQEAHPQPRPSSSPISRCWRPHVVNILMPSTPSGSPHYAMPSFGRSTEDTYTKLAAIPQLVKSSDLKTWKIKMCNFVSNDAIQRTATDLLHCHADNHGNAKPKELLCKEKPQKMGQQWNPTPAFLCCLGPGPTCWIYPWEKSSSWCNASFITWAVTSENNSHAARLLLDHFKVIPPPEHERKWLFPSCNA